METRVKQFQVWIADFNPRMGTETGKTRPVVVIQTDLLNKLPHPSTLICPLTTKVLKKATLLRVYLSEGDAGLKESCDIMIDQVRAIDNERLIRKLGMLSEKSIAKVKENLKIVLDIE